MKKIIFILLLALLLVGCDQTEIDENVVSDLENQIANLQEDKENLEANLEDQLDNLEEKKNEVITDLENQLSTLKEKNQELMQSQGPAPAQHEVTAAMMMLELIMDEDWNALSDYVTANDGLTLSPYQYVSSSDLNFSPSQVENFASDSNTYTWGSYDGSGEPIELTFEDYYDRFIYDQDFMNAPVLGIDYVVSSGNTINNIGDYYSGASFVEFYFPELDPQYEGMDWRSVTLVVEEIGGQWKLLGIIHGEWTI